MSEKLRNALNSLQQSVESFEKNFMASQSNIQNAPRKVDQHDLFGLSQDRQNTQNSHMITAVLDRTITRMEKLVGENV